MLLPAPLRPGDRVALIAPCSPVRPERLAYAAEFIAGLGYTPEIYPSCHARDGFLAGDDALRADDLNRAFADASVRAVVVARGGYGGARLTDRLDYEAIRRNPKIFTGFSDATVLHWLIGSRCGLVTFHAPMPAAANFPDDAYTRRALADVLAGRWRIAPDNAGAPLGCLCPGSAEGRLVGGNLTVLASTAGTPYRFGCQDCVLFLEDVGEYAYAIDRSLRQLLDSGMLQGCRGVLLGTWKDCAAPSDMPLREVFRRAFAPLGIPVISGLLCGHSVPSMALPLGLRVRMESSAAGCRVEGSDLTETREE